MLRALQKAGVTVCETAARRKIGDKARRMVELAVSAEEALHSDGEAILSPAAGGGASPGGRGADERGGGLLLHRRLHGRPPGHGEGGDRGLFRGGGAAAAGPDARWSPAAPSSSMRSRRRPFSLSWTLTEDREAGGGAAPGRHRQRQDPGLSPAGPGDTAPGTAGHGPGAGDRADAPDDARGSPPVLGTRWPCSTAPCG